MNDYKIKISFPSGKQIETAPGVTAAQYTNELGVPKNELYAVKMNNEVCSLNRAIIVDTDLVPVTSKSPEGAIVYRHTLCFVMEAAQHNIAPDKQLIIGHSISYGYYYTFKDGTKITSDFIKSLKAEMDRLIKENLPIDTHFVSYQKAIEICEKFGLEETKKQLTYTCLPRIQMNLMGDFSDIHISPLLISTGMLNQFELMEYGEGFLLRFPRSHTPEKLPEFEDIPVLQKTFEKYKKWGKQLGVVSVASLNELVNKRKANDFINITETFQEKCISEIADQIQRKGQVRLVLIAGPSSSGKTTTSKKLALELQAIGYTPKVISLDSYYVGRDRNPKDENGNYDYECLEALDVELINQNLVDLLAGKTVELPRYDFTSGERYYKGDYMTLEPNDILVMEGIHGLNDKLTPLVKNEFKFKLYLSALTQLSLNEHNLISTSDNRLIRRIVRDSNFRGKPAATTISMWASVQKGERLHIFPFQNNADAILNTALDYELSVLKVYAEPLLRCIRPDQVEYAEACRLLRFLNNFPPIPAAQVPDRSIIREFIGGSAFKY